MACDPSKSFNVTKLNYTVQMSQKKIPRRISDQSTPLYDLASGGLVLHTLRRPGETDLDSLEMREDPQTVKVESLSVFGRSGINTYRVIILNLSGCTSVNMESDSLPQSRKEIGPLSPINHRKHRSLWRIILQRVPRHMATCV